MEGGKEEGDPQDQWQQEVKTWGIWRELGKSLREDEPFCAIEKDLERIRSNTKVNQHYARMIKGSQTTIVEIFNPKRFAPHCPRSGLMAAAAFVLELGDDLLDPRQRDRVLKFIKEFKPGLTVISPPCTLFSIMQNMNVTKKDFARRLRESRILLNFARSDLAGVGIWRYIHLRATFDIQSLDGESSTENHPPRR